MKKLIALTLVLVLAFSLAACGGTDISQNEWPENKFTQLVTKPDFTVSAVTVESYSCKVRFDGVTAEQLKAYAQTLQADGFRYNVDEQEDMTGAYRFEAWNVESGEGYYVILCPDIFGGADAMVLEITEGTI